MHEVLSLPVTAVRDLWAPGHCLGINMGSEQDVEIVVIYVHSPEQLGILAAPGFSVR